jgi:DNA-nicking Smr family endonuclease
MTRKPYQVPDLDLWTELAKSLRPLSKRARKTSEPAKTLHKQARPAGAAAAPAALAPAIKLARNEPPPLSGIDRRTGQRLTRGQVDIDARIDLHGTGVELARHRLLGFLTNARTSGNRLVLVITGKGASPFARHTLHGSSHFHAPEREGRLRRLLPEWLNEPEFRSLVSGFQPAHPRHGGGGAFYVKMRRDRRHP